jgi:putative PIN family toxin of toxin-antitoxin system
VIRAVIDTSVLIRYLIKPSAAIKELIEEWWLGDELQMVTAPELIAELEGVLGRDYIQTLIRPEEGEALLEAISAKAEILPPLGQVPAYTRDPKDDKFVACALVGGANYIISEDKDILVLGVVGDGRIVTPYDFVHTIPRCFLTGTRPRRSSFNSAQKIRSQVHKTSASSVEPSKQPLITPTTTARRGP